MSEAPLVAGGEPGRVETRERLLTAAAEVIAAKGFERASLAEIAKSAGLTTGAVYSTYGSKWELLKAVTQQLAEDDDDPLQVDDGETLELFIDRISERFCSFVASHDATSLGILQFEALLFTLRNPALLDDARPSRREDLTDLAAALDALAARSAHALPANSMHLARLMMALSQSLQLHQLLDPDEVGVEDYRRGLRLVVGLRP